MKKQGRNACKRRLKASQRRIEKELAIMAKILRANQVTVSCARFNPREPLACFFRFSTEIPEDF